MKILSLKTIHGPNIYHHKPVVLMKVDLEHLTDLPSSDIFGFTKRLLELFPGLYNHGCSLKKKGGFVERLERGTYPAHIIEHIAIELSNLCNIPVHFGKTRYAGQYGHYDIAVRFKNEYGMKECLKSAFSIYQQLLHETSINLGVYLQKVKAAVNDTSLGVTTQALVEAAEKRNIPVMRIGTGSLFQLGYGKRRKLLQAAVTSETSLIGADLAQDKALTKEILLHAMVPVPKGLVLRDLEDLENTFSQLNPPYALKPLDGNHGKGVSLNLKTLPELRDAFVEAKKHSPDVLLEEMIFGDDYRLLVIDGTLRAAARRLPASVIGNGKNTIEELIQITNQDPLRGEGHATFLSAIEVDDVLISYLKQQGLELSSVPADNIRVQLRGNANLSTGGVAEDVTHLVHPEVKFLAERIARLINLNICGIDVICDDISKSPTNNFSVIEVNAGPGLRMHLAKQDSHQIADSIIGSLYPVGTSSRVPIISVTGTNGKTTIVRLLKHLLQTNSQTCVGMTSTEGVWIDDKIICKGDCSGPISSQVLLRDPTIDVAVLEVARGGVVKNGLGYDWSDISIVSNITADHIGQDGIENLEDLIWVKSLVAERVKPNGVLVLNSENPASLNLKNNPAVLVTPKKIVLYGLRLNPDIQSHLNQGGTALWVSEGWIVQGQGPEVLPLLPVKEVPLTYGGTLDFNISNVLAASAAALALHQPLSQITDGLKTFYPSLQNPGRMNIYKVREAFVIVDYGHNEDAIQKVGKFIQQFGFKKRSLIVGLPGDRQTELIQETSRVIPQYFSEVYLRDELDLRGRAPLEVPKIMAEQMPTTLNKKIIPTETEALNLALSQLERDEVLVILYEDTAKVYAALNEYDPQPVSQIPITISPQVEIAHTEVELR